MRFKILPFYIIVIIMILFNGKTFAASYAADQDVSDNGDDITVALFLAAYASTAIAQDWEGTKQFTYSAGTTTIITSLLKKNMGNNRPLSYNYDSFPSGHSALAFSSAAFIDTRYGHSVGIPAYLFASYVGYSRVVTDEHYISDVLAGISIGLFSNWYWVSPRKSKAMLLPTVVEDGVGISLNIMETEKKNIPLAINDIYPKFHYEMLFGPTRVESDQITSPAATGTTFNLFDFFAFGDNGDKSTKANLNISSQLNRRHTIGITIEPYENSDVRELSYTVRFADTTFPAGSHLESSYRRIDLRLNYYFDLMVNFKSDINIGAALTALHTSIKLEDISSSGVVDQWMFFPIVHINVEYPLYSRWTVFAFAGGAAWLDVNYINAKLMLRYQFDKHWGTGVGFGMYDSKIDATELKNDLEYNSLLFSIAYTF